MKKIINAILKKMIHQERMLMIVEDNKDLNEKILQLHPNYVEWFIMNQNTKYYYLKS